MTPTRTTIALAIAALILSAAASLARADELPPIPAAVPPVVIPTATLMPSPTLMPKGDPLFRRYLPIVQGGGL